VHIKGYNSFATTGVFSELSLAIARSTIFRYLDDGEDDPRLPEVPQNGRSNVASDGLAATDDVNGQVNIRLIFVMFSFIIDGRMDAGSSRQQLAAAEWYADRFVQSIVFHITMIKTYSSDNY